MAAARVDRPSLVKMLLTCRATVFSLMPSSSAIARLVLPVATRRSTSTSRAVSARGSGAAGMRERAHPPRVRAGAELPEDLARRVELHRRGVLVAERAAGEPDEHPRPARPRRAPRARASAPHAWRSAASARCGRPSPSRTAPRRLRGHRVEQRRAAGCASRDELVGRRAGRTGLARGEHDLDARGEHRRAARRGSRASSSARRIAARRGVDLALRQPQQREPRLRVASPAAGLPVALLGLRELAAQPVELGQLVKARADRAVRPAGRARQSHARSSLAPARPARRRAAAVISARCTRHWPR